MDAKEFQIKLSKINHSLLALLILPSLSKPEVSRQKNRIVGRKREKE